MYILGIDSSTAKLSISVSDTGTLNNIKTPGSNVQEFSRQEGFMVNIIPDIDMVLKKSGLEINDVNAFCVNRGPGDFTGTRIGISVIKTFAMACKKPAYGIDSLDVFAAQAASLNSEKISSMLCSSFDIIIVPVIDVKRDEVFFSVYKASFAENSKSSFKLIYKNDEIFINKLSSGNLVEQGSFLPTLEEMLEEFLRNTGPAVNAGKKSALFFCGTAFNSCKYLWPGVKRLKYRRVFLERKALYPQASFLNQCALYRMGIKPGSIESIVPYYVREFVPFSKNKK